MVCAARVRMRSKTASTCVLRRSWARICGDDVDYVIMDSSRKTNIVRENTGLICLDGSTNEKAFV